MFKVCNVVFLCTEHTGMVSHQFTVTFFSFLWVVSLPKNTPFGKLLAWVTIELTVTLGL